MKITIDANILVYAFDRSEAERHAIARDIVARATNSDCVLTLQSLAETYRTVSRKRIVAPQLAEEYVQALSQRFRIVTASMADLRSAMRVVREHKIAFWDAMLWATAAAAGCRMMISEDFQTNRQLGPIVFRSPFGATLPPDLDEALEPL